ncbi:MAG: SCO family protein [Leptospira sp.]|nr:SCO family protein [Leptospira sp.]
MNQVYSIAYKILFWILIITNTNCTNNVLDTNHWEQYQFVTPEGKSLESSFWKSKKSVIYFGFSHCPDMCPLALTNFGKASMILGDKSGQFQFVFITLDPNRDSPELLNKYTKQFPGKNLIALSPSNQTLIQLKEDLGVIGRKVGDGKNYLMDHSNIIYVIDETGKSIANFPGGISANTLATKLRGFL